MSKLFERCKNEVAKKHGWSKWDMIDWYAEDEVNWRTEYPYSQDVYEEEAAELYAERVVKSKLLELREKVEQSQKWNNGQSELCVKNGSMPDHYIGAAQECHKVILLIDEQPLTEYKKTLI